MSCDFTLYNLLPAYHAGVTVFSAQAPCLCIGQFYIKLVFVRMLQTPVACAGRQEYSRKSTGVPVTPVSPSTPGPCFPSQVLLYSAWPWLLKPHLESEKNMDLNHGFYYSQKEGLGFSALNSTYHHGLGLWWTVSWEHGWLTFPDP